MSHLSDKAWLGWGDNFSFNYVSFGSLVSLINHINLCSNWSDRGLWTWINFWIKMNASPSASAWSLEKSIWSASPFFLSSNVFSCLLSVFDPNILLSSEDYNCTVLFVYCHCILSYCKKKYSDFTSGMCKLLSFVYLNIIKRISIFFIKIFYLQSKPFLLHVESNKVKFKTENVLILWCTRKKVLSLKAKVNQCDN